LAIIILCTSAWWTSADALAQEAAPASLKMIAQSTLWSLEGLGSNTAPHLVIGMADGGDTSLWLARDEATNPSARNETWRTVGPAASVNTAERGESGPLVLSSFFEPTAGVRGFPDLRAEATIERHIIQNSPDQASANVYSLLDDGPAPGPSLYGYRMKYSLSRQWLADNESFTHEKPSYARLGSGATSKTIEQTAAIMLLISVSQFPHGR
jgi:hypothetical protein